MSELEVCTLIVSFFATVCVLSVSLRGIFQELRLKAEAKQKRIEAVKKEEAYRKWLK